VARQGGHVGGRQSQPTGCRVEAHHLLHRHQPVVAGGRIATEDKVGRPAGRAVDDNAGQRARGVAGGVQHGHAAPRFPRFRRAVRLKQAADHQPGSGQRVHGHVAALAVAGH
jgi:hypothetical protein